MIKEKVQVRAALKNLHIYRAHLHEQQRRDDLRETKTASVVETLTKIQAKLDDGLDWETKREIVKLLVRRIIVKTEKNSDRKPRPIATVIYSFEDHSEDTPIPVEMSPLFNGVVLHSLTNRAILSAKYKHIVKSGVSSHIWYTNFKRSYREQKNNATGMG